MPLLSMFTIVDTSSKVFFSKTHQGDRQFSYAANIVCLLIYTKSNIWAQK